MSSESGPATTPRAAGALAGAVAAAVALAVGELLSAIDDAGVSLVTSVGDEVIDRFAGSLKDLAVEMFGTNDKAALVVGIVVVSLALGAAIGVAAGDRPWLGPVGFGAFAAAGFIAYDRATQTDPAIGAVATIGAAIAGVVTLWFLLGRARSEEGRSELPAALDDGVARGATLGKSPVAEGGPTAGSPRRAFLTAAAVLGVGAAGTAALSRRVRGPDPTDVFRQSTAVPSPETVTPVPATQPFREAGLSPYVTPTPDFYRIDTALVVPRVDATTWRLELGGHVDRPVTLTFDDLLARDAVEEPVTLQCVSNEVGGDLVGNARWQGVPLLDLLDEAGVRSEGTQVIGRSIDGWTAGFPTELLRDGRTALVAYAMNGELLTPKHGFPARLIVAGLYGYVSATKWLTEIELTRLEDVDAYWVPRGWAKDGPIKIASRIDVPRAGARLPSGETAVAGVAWAPNRGVAGVEVRVDDGPWRPCELGEAASGETWVQWRFVWDATAGDHVLAVRAIAGDGEVQTDAVAPPRPDGATGHHARRVRVDA